MIRNPILCGFNPDPSILRVKDDYYIATSTFEWFPGVQIHHSRDLVNWRLIGHALDDPKKLDMTGVPDSGGIWAPCLTWSNGLFWLIYTNVLSYDGSFKDTPNFLVTAKRITGPWSKPVYLNSTGFDPSLFHDDDGRKWLVNMMWDHRAPAGKNAFGGILLQEYDARKKRLVGPVKNIYSGSDLKVTEGPHIYKKDGWYYLMVAEGGTGYEHAVTVARGRFIDGPYETMPDNPLISSRWNPKNPVQKTGHGSLVEAADGSWYVAHLGARPLTEQGACPLGRETFLTKVEWFTPEGDAGPWLRVAGGGREASLEVANPCLESAPFAEESPRLDFDDRKLSKHLNSLRRPISRDWLSLKARTGFLRLYGSESPSSKFRQSMIARRVRSFSVRVETAVDFRPESPHEMAGLIWYYNTALFAWLFVSFDEKLGRVVNVLTADGTAWTYPVGDGVAVDSGTAITAERIFLRAESRGKDLDFSWSRDGSAWNRIGPTIDASRISDEGATHYPDPGWGFTGTFVGLQCTDLTGKRKQADFDYFEYRDL